jgi:hypothetical protein
MTYAKRLSVGLKRLPMVQKMIAGNWTQRVDEMLTSGKWRELAATWEEFCVEYFKKPSAFIDAIVESVLVLDANDTSAVSGDLKLY